MLVGNLAARSALFEHLARVGKALGAGKRLELIELLAQGPRSVVDLAEVAHQAVTTVSTHLQTLKQAGLVRTTRDGTTIYYALASDEVAALYTQLLTVGSIHLADVDVAARDYLGPNDTEEIGREELLRRAKVGEVTVIDVRPREEYAHGHIPGALSIPYEELADRLDELPEDLEVVAYCRGPYCVFSHDAVRYLIRHGRRAVRLEEGIVEWGLADLTVEPGIPN